MQAVGLSGARGPRHLRRVALDADHVRNARGEGQREISEAAEQIERALVRPELQQRQRTPHQHFVDRVIDLCEIGRCERKAYTELAQLQLELYGLGRIQRRRGAGSSGLEPD